MAISNTNLVQTNKPLSLPLLAFIAFFLMLLNRVNSTSSLSFSYDGFVHGQQDLVFQGDAKISSSKAIELTKKDSNGVPLILSVGRVLHSSPVHLWDNTTGNVASFETTFTFVVTSPIDHPAHGLAFFIAPPDTTIPFNSTRGALGLFDYDTALDPSANQVVAVEFDTYPDPEWDPSYRHIGIDINTIQSSAHVQWERQPGEIAEVHVSYNPGTGRLRVISSYPDSTDYVVSYFVDLKTVLPEWVRVGFSAATGNYIQTHDLLSWSFSSTLQDSTTAKEKDMYIARYV